MAIKIDSITSTKTFESLAKGANKVADSIGGAIEKSSHKDTFDKVFSAIEPTHSNNSFIALAATMFLGVLAPRVATALKRNPDNKEATKDEITDILFRDVQTILIMLFALNSVNAIVAGKATKMSGLPMTDKPYQKVFNTAQTGIKGIGEKAKEFVSSPIEKLKAIGKNVVDTINPLGGVNASKNEALISKYTNYNSSSEIVKLLKDFDVQGGSSKKAYDKIIDSLIKDQEDLLNGNYKKGIKGLIRQAKQMSSKDASLSKYYEEHINNAQKILEELKGLKDKDFTALDSPQTSDAVKDLAVAFFKDKNNALISSALGLNAVLRTAALTFEAFYLGLGLPALNQKRLKKKYLGEGAQQPQNQQAVPSGDKMVLSSKNISDKQVKIYSQFIK